MYSNFTLYTPPLHLFFSLLSSYDLSHGNILPLVARPFGFTSFAPQTDNDSNWASWWFHPSDMRFFGVRCTRQPSPWIGSYGDFRIAATITDPGHSDSWQFSSYVPWDSLWLPYYFNASFAGYSNGQTYTSLELSSTSHGAILRITYPPYVSGPALTGYNQTRRILISTYGSLGDDATVSQSPLGLAGISTYNSGGVTGNFGQYFNLTIGGGADGSVDLSAAVVGTGTGQNEGAYSYIDLDPTNPITDVITIRVATSLISAAQASLNLDSELTGKSFDDIEAESKAEWNTLLSRINVVDVGAAYYTQEEIDAYLTTFYSALYRASIYPRFLNEMTPNGMMHYSPYDPQGRTLPGSIITDSGFWDAYRTVYPFHSIWAPDILGEMINGWVTAYQEGGWLPKWASPGYRGSMVGTMGDVSLADAIVKGIPGFNASVAYEAIRKDAFVVPTDNPGLGRTCLQAYLQNGYIPRDAPIPGGNTCWEVVSRSLNYMLSDFAISKAAATLGYTADAAVLAARSANYSLLFDSTTGFMRSKENNQFTTPFDEFAWGGDYTEAGPWQYRLYVPHDPKGLFNLYSSAGLDVCDIIEQMQTMPGTFHAGGYGSQIHEQTEMASLCWGQYEHDNQPIHYLLPLAVASDNTTSGRCAAVGHFWMRQVTSLLYRPGADYAVGDEDNGQLSTWYLLNVMGLYSLAPGTNDLVIGSPLFSHLTINLLNNKTIEIIADNNCADCYYVSSVSWNGTPITGVTIDYTQLMQGGTLHFVMTANAPPGSKTGHNPAAKRIKADVERSRGEWHANGRRRVF